MTDVLKKLTAAGFVGLLAGLVLVWWIEPTTTGGIALLILICIAVSEIIGSLLAWFGILKPPPATKRSDASGDDDKTG
jgi:hypothetical protein